MRLVGWSERRRDGPCDDRPPKKHTIIALNVKTVWIKY